MDRMMAYMEKKCIGIPMKAAREALVKYHQQHQPTAKEEVKEMMLVQSSRDV